MARRYIIIGGGAIGAHAAAQLTLAGIPAVLVARGTQLDALLAGPLTVQRRDSVDTVRLTVVGDAAEAGLTPDDVLVLAVKTQDAEAAVSALAWLPLVAAPADAVAAELPIVVLQNGVATEDIARRRFARVVSVGTIVPVTYLEPGHITTLATPLTGYLQLGALDGRQDADRELVESVAADFAAAGYLTRVREDITRRKHEKLLHNITNAVDVFAGEADERAALSDGLVAETRAVLAAAGWEIADRPDSDVDLGAAFGGGPGRSAPAAPSRRSTWQSFARGVSTEVDFLNGEVVLLGRRHAVPTPLNERVQRVLGLSHTLGEPPQTRRTADILEPITTKEHDMSLTDTAAAAATATDTTLKLGFLTNGAYSTEAPGGAAQGHREVIDLFRQAEGLGYDRGWVRNRHFDSYVSSPLSVIAAAAQHTERIGLGTAIIPVGYEHPIRLAEDAATVDLLTDQRLELGIATGIPGFDGIFGHTDPRPYKVTAAEKVDRFLDAIAGQVLGYGQVDGPGPAVVANPADGRFIGPDGEAAPGHGTAYYVRPHSQTLRDRIWYGPGGVDTAARAAEQGLDLLLSAIGPNIGLSFEEAQRAQIEAHAAAWTRTDRRPRVSAARLFFPFVNDRQRRLYQDYAELRATEGPAASRPQGSLPPRAAAAPRDVPAATGGPGLMSPVVVAEPAEVIEYLRSDVAVQASGELMIFLPPGFSHRDNVELIENIAGLVAGSLGWTAAR